MSDEINDEVEVEPDSPFLEWLKDHRGGLLLMELEDAVKDVVNGVQKHGKKGTIDLKLNFIAHGRTIEITDDVKSKPPREPRTGDIFFADRDGVLHREDPDQMKIDFKQVPMNDGTLRVVDTDTGELKKAGGE